MKPFRFDAILICLSLFLSLRTSAELSPAGSPGADDFVLADGKTIGAISETNSDLAKANSSGADFVVLRNAALTSSVHQITNPGLHVLKIWMVDLGIVLDTIEAETGVAQNLGYVWPPETKIVR